MDISKTPSLPSVDNRGHFASPLPTLRQIHERIGSVRFVSVSVVAVWWQFWFQASFPGLWFPVWPVSRVTGFAPVRFPVSGSRGNFVWSKCGQSVVVRSLEKHSTTLRKSIKRERESGPGPDPAGSGPFWADPAGSEPGLSLFVDILKVFECSSRLLTTTL